MSWKNLNTGRVLSGPPTGSNTNKLDPRFRPNLGGQTAFQREQALVHNYGSRHDTSQDIRRSDWDVLKENHRFIRDDEEPSDVSWEERLARAYESKLFKEFALIDLKHFKSRRLALRWRTAEEVVDGIGEDTCAGLRCKHHQPVTPSPRHNRALWEDASTPGPSVSVRDDSGTSRHSKKRMPPLRSFELPFVYEEHGERKEALVKVKLCAKCQTKLAWKPGKDSGPSEEDEREFDRQSLPSSDRLRRPRSLVDRSQESDRHGRDRHHADSRSRSPESRHKHRRHR